MTFLIRLTGMGLMLLAMAGCYRQVEQTLEVRIPQMRTQQAADLVRASLSMFDTGTVLRVDTTDLSQRVARVTYDTTRAGRKNIEKAIAATGMDANDEPGNPERRRQLPPELR